MCAKPRQHPITALELEQAKLLWDKHVQLEHYNDVIHSTKKGAKNNLKYQLNLQMDPNGLLRCHGRLTKRKQPSIPNYCLRIVTTQD